LLGDRWECRAVGAAARVCGEPGREPGRLVAQCLQSFLEAGDAVRELVGSEFAVLEGLVVAVERTLGLCELALARAVVCFECGPLVLLASCRFGYRGLEQLSVAVEAQ
jgi:hypothetical protein